jgi:ATP-dependent helicase/nuclease subunit A
VILDYKTDRVEDEEAFVSVYRPQLKWYAQAVSELTGKEVKESWLYSISRQQAYRV